MKKNDFFKQIRKAKFCSKFAAQCGISPAFLSLIMAGKRRPSPELALKMEEISLGALNKYELVFAGVKR